MDCQILEGQSPNRTSKIDNRPINFVALANDLTFDAVLFMTKVKIIETPRDGWQGLDRSIPTTVKIDYINTLLKVGFDTVEIGSFISAKSIPQLADTEEVIHGIDTAGTNSKIMVLVANEKGADKAVNFQCIDYLLFPFSASPTFLKRNINSDFTRSFRAIHKIMELCDKCSKKLIVYITMGFGNPYGDDWSIDMVVDWAGRLYELGSRIIPLSDITGEATTEKIENVYNQLITCYPDVEYGLHLHATKEDWYDKVDAAYRSGCRRFDTVLGGVGGCPMTGKELLSNLDTSKLLSYLDDKHISYSLNKDELNRAFTIANNILINE